MYHVSARYSSSDRTITETYKNLIDAINHTRLAYGGLPVGSGGSVEIIEGDDTLGYPLFGWVEHCEGGFSYGLFCEDCPDDTDFSDFDEILSLFEILKG